MRYVLSLVFLVHSTASLAQWQLHDPQGNPIQPGLNYAAQGEFATQQIATTDPEQLHKDWAQPTPGVEISTQDTATRNQPIFQYIIFRGCKAGPDGNCHVTVKFVISDPKGKPYGPPQVGPVWDLPPPPAANLQLSDTGMGLRVEAGELLGKYTVIAQTTDRVANITLTTEQTLTINEAPLAGGWSAVDAPSADQDVRAAADAMLAQLPLKHARLRRIETAQRQVVAGTNYRLKVSLSDGSRWSALVWHKLDGSFVVSDPSRLR